MTTTIDETTPVAVFSRPGCGHCIRAKALLFSKGIGFEDIQVGLDISRNSMQAVSGATTVPQIFIGGEHIGGADDLEQYFTEQQQVS